MRTVSRRRPFAARRQRGAWRTVAGTWRAVAGTWLMTGAGLILGAAMVAGCATGTTEESAESEAASPSVNPARFVDTGSPSVVLALAPMRLDTFFGQAGWSSPRSRPEGEDEPCRTIPSAAATSAHWYQMGTMNSAYIRVTALGSEAEAEAGLDRLGNLTAECTEAIAERNEQRWSNQGLGQISAVDPAGTEIESEDLPEQALIREFRYTTAAGDLVSTSTVYRDGTVLTEVHLLGLAEQFDVAEQLESAATFYQAQRPGVPSQPELQVDPEVDERVEDVRAYSASIDLDEPSYANYGDIWLDTLDPNWLVDNCFARPSTDAKTVGVFGPTWAAAGGNSLVTQDVWLYPDAQAAQDATEQFRATSAVCDDAPLASLALVSSATSEQTVGGRELVMLEANLELSSGDAQLPLLLIGVRTAVGAQVLSTTFLGIDGDQPDLLAWTGALAEELAANEDR